VTAALPPFEHEPPADPAVAPPDGVVAVQRARRHVDGRALGLQVHGTAVRRLVAREHHLRHRPVAVVQVQAPAAAVVPREPAAHLAGHELEDAVGGVQVASVQHGHALGEVGVVDLQLAAVLVHRPARAHRGLVRGQRGARQAHVAVDQVQRAPRPRGRAGERGLVEVQGGRDRVHRAPAQRAVTAVQRPPDPRERRHAVRVQEPALVRDRVPEVDVGERGRAALQPHEATVGGPPGRQEPRQGHVGEGHHGAGGLQGRPVVGRREIEVGHHHPRQGHRGQGRRDAERAPRVELEVGEREGAVDVERPTADGRLPHHPHAGDVAHDDQALRGRDRLVRQRVVAGRRQVHDHARVEVTEDGVVDGVGRGEGVGGGERGLGEGPHRAQHTATRVHARSRAGIRPPPSAKVDAVLDGSAPSNGRIRVVHLLGGGGGGGARTFRCVDWRRIWWRSAAGG
jgi:hypothetical protein